MTHAGALWHETRHFSDAHDGAVAPLRHISNPEEGVKSPHALAEQLNASGWEGISGAVSYYF